MTTIILVTLAGVLAGAWIGRSRSCTTGSCPLTATPLRGAIYGGVMAFLASISFTQGNESVRTTTPSTSPATETKSDDKPKWHSDYSKALAEAQGNNRPILILFTGSDWCTWCVKMDEEIWSEKDFQTFAKANLNLLRVDFPRSTVQDETTQKQNRDLAMRYGARGYPTVILTNPSGDVIATTGYRRGGATSYIKHLEEILAAHSMTTGTKTDS